MKCPQCNAIANAVGSYVSVSPGRLPEQALIYECPRCGKVSDSVEERACYLCKYFFPGVPGTRYDQRESAECSHDKSWICHFNLHFPFLRGCKNFERRAE